MKTLALSLTVLACAALTAQADQIAYYDFDASTGAATSSAANTTASEVTLASGTPSFFAGMPSTGKAIAGTNFNDADGNSFLFTITVDAGHTLDLSSVTFDERASGTGPLNFELFVNSGSIGTGSIPHLSGTTFSPHSVSSSLTALTGVLSFELRGTGATSAAGTWRIDNLTVNGTVGTAAVPEPASFALLGLGGLAIGGVYARRRRAGRSA